MISKEILECVEVGILTDVQLFEAISHYTELEKNLKCHGERYHLVWKDVFYTLNTLKGYAESRKENRKRSNENKNLTFKVTVEYTCKNMIDSDTLYESYDGIPLMAYKYISNNFSDSVYNYSSSEKVISVEIM